MIYPKSRAKILTSDIDWDADDFRVALVSSTYVPDFDNDEFYDDLSGVVDVSDVLTGNVAVDGELIADPAAFTAVSGSDVVAGVIYKDTGSSATSSLVAFFDNCPEFPYTPTGSDLELTWGDGATPTGVVSRVSEIAGFPTLVDSTSSNSPTLAVPTGTAEGDLMIAAFSVRGTGMVTVTTGWDWVCTPVLSSSSASGNVVMWKVAGASEPADYTFTGAGSFGEEVGIMATFTGCKPYPVGTMRATTSSTLQEVIPGARHALWVGVAMFNSANGGITPTSTWTNATEIVDLGATRIHVSMAYAPVDNGPAETSLGVTVTASYLDNTCAFAVVA